MCRYDLFCSAIALPWGQIWGYLGQSMWFTTRMLGTCGSIKTDKELHFSTKSSAFKWKKTFFFSSGNVSLQSIILTITTTSALWNVMKNRSHQHKHTNVLLLKLIIKRAGSHCVSFIQSQKTYDYTCLSIQLWRYKALHKPTTAVRSWIYTFLARKTIKSIN